MTAGQPEGQTFAGESLLLRYVNFVKLPHTVFALPFAFLGVVYASFATTITLQQVVLVLVAFTAARFAAMGFNRIVDRRYDARNPRTMHRELPAGRLSLTQAVVSVVAACGVFVAAAALLNPLCLALSPLALAWILFYSFTKRLTPLSHLWLGLGLGIAPGAGYLAVTGVWSEPWWTLPVIALAVLTWVGGFDIFYALPDESFDREHGLKSAVVLLGQRQAILLAKLLHGVTVGALVGFGLGTPFGAVYYAGVVVAAVLLAWEHQLVRPGDLSRLDAAFFRLNGIVSIVVLLFALGDRLI
ncbi:MAG: UbiA family prenyltransferase [Gemmatimonadota bacterium]|nr:MAG: UbiA family prenyltransferase [Gemmatimonadota bacterium]